MAKQQKTEGAAQADVPVPTNVTETAPVAVAEVPAKRKRRKSELCRTIADAFAGYLAALDERGGSTCTIASYRMELDLAGKALGIDTHLTGLTDTQIAAYFESDPVVRKRTG